MSRRVRAHLDEKENENDIENDAEHENQNDIENDSEHENENA